MTYFLSHLHNDLRECRKTRRGGGNSNAPTGLHKQYLRMEQILLPEPKTISTSLTEVINARSSYLAPPVEKISSYSLETWGTLLGTAIGKRKDGHRNYPSGGALYPIETYILTKLLTDDSVFVYHYNPSKHSLEKLWKIPPHIIFRDIIVGPDEHDFSSILVFTSVWERSSIKYGDFTYTVGLLEAGHMSENILLTASALGLASRPMAGFKDEYISFLLELFPDKEQPVHTITLH